MKNLLFLMLILLMSFAVQAQSTDALSTNNQSFTTDINHPKLNDTSFFPVIADKYKRGLEVVESVEFTEDNTEVTIQFIPTATIKEIKSVMRDFNIDWQN